MRLGEKEKTEKPVRQQSLKKEKKKGFLLLGWPKGLIPPPPYPTLPSSLRDFLDLWGPLVLALVDPSALKTWVTYMQAYMPYESSEFSSNQPNGPTGSPRRLPRTPCPPPHGPPRTPWPSSLGFIGLLRSPGLPYKSSEDPSNVAIDHMGHLTPPSWPPGTL